MRGHCPQGDRCTARHPTRGKTVVCKHWLRGLCKKGDTCEFLHEYNMRKMPECWFFSKYKECSNAECIYLHIDPATKVRECHDYTRGFCRLGPACKHKHIKKPLCALYLSGFCPAGPECTSGHPKIADPHLAQFLASIAAKSTSAAPLLSPVHAPAGGNVLMPPPSSSRPIGGAIASRPHQNHHNHHHPYARPAAPPLLDPPTAGS